ncbi:MAG: monovalent cation:proton antiporter family protein [Deltaproteobacteria bacterium]|nr:monovalent cation:proton antiporter family protein [Deltaproteobacteria bacterium]
MGHELNALLLVMVLAASVPILANRLKRFRVPIVVGEILCGIMVGKSGFNLVGGSPALEFLGEFGFIYLMFLSGLELDFAQVGAGVEEERRQPGWRRVRTLAVAGFLCTLLLAEGAGFLFRLGGLAKDPVLMGLILSTTSLGIVVPVLKERGLIKTSLGQLLLMSALIGDFVTLLLLGLRISLLRTADASTTMLFPVLLLAFGVAALFAKRVRHWAWLNRTMDELSHATAQIRIRLAFVILVGWALLSRALGVETILGAFLAGALISLISWERDALALDKLEAFGYGFFIPVFFIMVGASFDLRALLESPRALAAVPLVILAAYLVKLVPALLFRLRFDWPQTLAAGFLLSSRLSLIVAAASIALKMGIISQAVHSELILVAVVTCTVSPVLFNRFVPSPELTEREGIIIHGREHLAEFLGEKLRRAGEKVVFIACDLPQMARMTTGPQVCVLGPASDAAVLHQAGAATAEALVAMGEDPAENLAVCRLAKERFGVPNVVALADEPQQIAALEALGVRVIQTHLATAVALEGAVLFPSTFEMLMDMNYGIEFLDALTLNREMLGKSIRELNLPGRVLVIGLRRDGEALVPQGDLVLDFGDTVTLVGEGPELRRAKDLLQGKFHG